MQMRVSVENAGIVLRFPDSLIIRDLTIERIMKETEELTQEPFDVMQDSDRIDRIATISQTIIMEDGFEIVN